MSLDTFMDWKKKFDSEMEEKKVRNAVAEVKGKLTGRQLFEIDASLFSNIVEEFE